MPDYIKEAQDAYAQAKEAGVSGEQDELEAALMRQSIAASLLALIGLSDDGRRSQ